MDRRTSGAGCICWEPKLLELCGAEDILILNGRTQGDISGRCMCRKNECGSTVNYFIAFSRRFGQAIDMKFMIDGNKDSNRYPTWLKLRADEVMQEEGRQGTAVKVKWDSANREECAAGLQHELQLQLGPDLGKGCELL